MTTTTAQRLAAHYGMQAARRHHADVRDLLATPRPGLSDELRGYLRRTGIAWTPDLLAVAEHAYRSEVTAYVAHLGKRVENRSRPCPGLVGERIAIHAGKGHDGEGAVWTAHTAGPGNPGADLDAQGIVAVATVVGWVDDRGDDWICSPSLTSADAFEALRSPWWSGPCGWVLADVVVLATPVPCRGALGVWRLPPDVEAAVLAQIAK